jgi:hypothetical protein
LALTLSGAMIDQTFFKQLILPAVLHHACLMAIR